MNCIETAHRAEETIKKSRFIGIAMPCDNERAVIQNLNRLHSEFADASHIAFAYRLKRPDGGVLARFFDAGEPAGTAGKPIYQHIEGRDLINVVVAVVRYFGGIKLGAGGLTRAYGGTAKKAIEGSRIVPYIEYSEIELRLEYNQLQPLEYQLKQLSGSIVEQTFAENVVVVVRIPADRAEALARQFGTG